MFCSSWNGHLVLHVELILSVHMRWNHLGQMDRNVRELRDSIKVMMSKLAEKNPELQIDIEELSKLQPPSE